MRLSDVLKPKHLKPKKSVDFLQGDDNGINPTKDGQNLMAEVYLVSATCWAIQFRNLVSSSISANRYLVLPYTFKSSSSVLSVTYFRH